MEDEGQLDRILEEMQKRNVSLQQIEKQISEVQFRLEKYMRGVRLAACDTAKALVADRFRGRLKQELQRKIKHRNLVQAELLELSERYGQMRESDGSNQ
ncbi:MAG: hypothetical protein J5J00_10265 [Deltaproteobacteria bacterium]|nr:hypothetical protein [Deltaproteobacteria bacterium]